MKRITTVNGHDRMSTQDLLLAISEAVASGETEFQITASGQHDIGGPLWNGDGKGIRFLVTNPGQRVGSMCLPGTTVLVEGSAPADVGWLNSGGTVIVKGDAGDTAGHCAAGGKIFIGGRAGARSGSLMKHDPSHPQPELWILEHTGSFSFEFMGGGRAVVCGHNSQTLTSVLGERPCVGMVGGTVYFRGPAPQLHPGISVEKLDEEDISWLDAGLDEFLDALGRSRLKRELTNWQHWRKLVAVHGNDEKSRPDMSSFRRDRWIPGGIFQDIYADDFEVSPLVARGPDRINIPIWENAENKCSDCRSCLEICPGSAVKRRAGQDGRINYSANGDRCIGCGFCAAICPHGIWKLEKNNSQEC